MSDATRVGPTDKTLPQVLPFVVDHPKKKGCEEPEEGPVGGS